MRAGLARARNVPYAPLPTVYDGLFPNGTFLTSPTRERDRFSDTIDDAPHRAAEAADEHPPPSP